MRKISSNQNTISEVCKLEFVEIDRKYEGAAHCKHCFYQHKYCIPIPCFPYLRKDGKYGYYREKV